MVNDVYSEAERKMKKSIDSIVDELGSIRTGKATPALLENVKVEAYDQKTPLNQLASISVPDPKTLLVQPWDKSIAGDIVKAIQAAELGFNPQVDANVIRVPIPPLSEERRKELVKLCKKIAEEGRVAIRNVRREANDRLKKAEKDKDISEDEQHKAADNIQKLTDDFVKKIDEMVEKKEKDVMAI